MTRCLAQVSALVREEAGIVLPAHRHGALRAALRRVAPGLDSCAFVREATRRPGGRELVDRLIDEVTVQESSFLRDRAQLDLIDWRGLRAAGQAAGTSTSHLVRVWSSGCAHGEEAYTLALHACEAFAPLPHDPFPPSGESAFDVIACRNVLIYLGAPLAERVIDGLERALRPGGVLVLGAADALLRPAKPPQVTARPVPPAPSRSAARLRRPLGRPPTLSREARLAAALDAADRGRRDEAHAQVTAMLAEDPLDAEVQFVHGLIALEAGDPGAAAAALRRALYTDARFALAAFTLGRAYDALGDGPAARRSYRHALTHLDPDDQRHEVLLKHVDIGDIAAACRARLAGGQS